jgi:hypothetical protein
MSVGKLRCEWPCPVQSRSTAEVNVFRCVGVLVLFMRMKIWKGNINDTYTSRAAYRTTHDGATSPSHAM